MRVFPHLGKFLVLPLTMAVFSLFPTHSISAQGIHGISPDEVLVTWEKGEISLDRFVKYMRVVKGSDLLKLKPGEIKPALREMALNEFLSRKAAAEKFSYDKVFFEIAEAEGRRKVLPRIYVEKEITEKTTISDEEVAALVGEYSPVYIIRVISSRDKTKADRALALLLRGSKFEEVARTHSEGFLKERGGLFGDISKERKAPFTGEQFGMISKLRKGAFTDVFEMPTGWNIVYMERVVTAEEQKAAAIEKMRDAAKLEKERKAYREKVAQLRGKAQIRRDGKVLDKLIKHVTGGGGEFPPEVARQPAVRVNKKPIYAGEIEKSIRVAHSEKDLMSFLDKRIEDELVIQEAIRLGLGNQVAEEMDLLRKNWIARAYLAEQSREASIVSEQDLRKYYRENPDQFRVSERRSLQIIEVADEKTAKKIQKEIRGGASFDVLAAKHNMNPEAGKRKGHVGFLEKKQLLPGIGDPIFRMKKGEVSGTFVENIGDRRKVYAVVKVLEIQPAGVTPFEKVNRDVIRNRIITARKTSTLKPFLKGAPPLRWREESIKKVESLGG